MKKILFTLCLWLTVGWLWAQRSEPQNFTGPIVEQEVAVGSAEFHIQVGNPIHYSHHEFNDGASISLRFPWDVHYISLTFDDDFFEVSKGYHSDRVELNWTIQNNELLIDRIKVYRREYDEKNQDDISNFVEIATLSKDSYRYEDSDIQGGVLYEYKVIAEGVSIIPKKYVTYMTGIGYRNPTGVITGNISFDGGSPVKDVVIRADPQGADLAFGSSLLFNANSSLSIPLPNKELDGTITLQAWVKLNENSSATLFKLHNELNGNQLDIDYTTTTESLALSFGGSTITVRDFYPTGNVDGRGFDNFNAFSDAAQPQSNFANKFAHITVVLKKDEQPLFYMNGRIMDSLYMDYLESLPEDIVEKPVISHAGVYSFPGLQPTKVNVGVGLEGNIDEVRVWNKILTEKEIRTDFKRYLGGSEPNLISYLRCDEKVGRFAYDISKVGFDFNKNHAQINNGTWTEEKPTSSQLGILGVTDELGNYIISAIPYSGVGESYTITPLYGVHQFDPGQQLVFIGNGSEVINKIDFKDISAFNFIGEALYTSNDIFAPLDSVDNLSYIEEAGYNQYNSIISGTEELLSKGNHFYNGTTLYEMPVIPLAGANVYINGDIVLDRDKRPVVTGEDGKFNIKVPIGNHFIEVRKDKHHFVHNGRFPAAREDQDDLFEFFEHQQAAITFLDTTRVELTGRVVGGLVEAEKPIGFGYAGAIQETLNPNTDSVETIDISSINNIGQAIITMGYLPFGADPNTGELKYTFSTNKETGEYKVSLLPLSYKISETNGIKINSNSGLQLLKGDETVNLKEPRDPNYSEYINVSGDTTYSTPYHFTKSFVYRSTPVLNVVSQSSELEVTLNNGTSISSTGFAYPVYEQGKSYGILFETFEEYTNLDEADTIFDKVPVIDGEFSITNNLALQNSESLTSDESNKSLSRYTFKAGLPSISPPFTRNIDIKYHVNSKEYDARNYEKEGIILGGQSDGSQTFVTEAPDYPDIILRDPPGSNSFATIEEGKSISFTESGSFNISQSSGQKLHLALGATFKAGGGLAGPVIEAKGVNSFNAGISLAVESTHGTSVTKTYTFNKSISTSSDPLFVGSDGDLYIGNASNFFYGSYDKVQIDTNSIESGTSLKLINSNGDSVFVSKQKAYYFSEEPSETFFIYSQKYILNTLIPEIQTIIDEITKGALKEDTLGVLNKNQYEEQIKQWKLVIQGNEHQKYQALKERTALKDSIKSHLEKQIESIDEYLIAITVLGSGSAIAPGMQLVAAQTLTETITIFEAKKANLTEQIELLNDEFEQNISFDAGVGSYSKSTNIASVQEKTRSIKFDIDAAFETETGFKLNDAGATWTINNTLGGSINTALAESESESLSIKYTFQDHDKNNFLSVDIVNSFDGNGPIFSTVGGRTSCPYEGIDTTLFYNHTAYNTYKSASNVPVLSGGNQISYATQQIEKPKISIELASVVDVPEERAAEFMLILENNSVAEADSYFSLYVDNTTNPHNAKLNIGANGTVVWVPYGQKVEYALTLEKSISDVYEYKDINIYLGSICDPVLINDHVTVSATFRPSCTSMEIGRPLDNWIFNAGDAFNRDNTTNPMNISMFGYDRAFNSFENFTLQYRKSTSSSWTRLKTYYNTQVLLDEAISGGEDQGILITENTSNFSWDVGALGLADGQYELRAITSCSNETEFISDVVTGRVDFNVPQQFGTPSPTDGILGAGEDLQLKFSEDILYSNAISKIEIKGETNQQEINHNVSLYFEGNDNTVVIEKPNITPGDFTVEFWLKNLGSGTLFNQADGMQVVIDNGTISWTFDGKTLSESIPTDNAFHHYTLTYSANNELMKMYQDDQELGSLSEVDGLSVWNDNDLIIGGNTFKGNLHDLRFWSKPLSLSEAYAGQFNELIGSERDLVGYWPMKEGVGAYANDLARFKHATINAEWDIKPKGTAYDLNNGQYLELDQVDFVQLSDLMDITLSFWIKTNNTQKSTIFSNGRGNEEDLIQSNGKANKWAVSLDNGILYLFSEGNQYALSSTNLADNSWHHVAIVLRRIGSLKTYVDANLESSNPVNEIGGLSGNKFWVGARGFISSLGVETVDEEFTGKIDELRLWNLARATEQIERDRFNEVDFNSIGLMLYARMNEPDPLTGAGPKYYHLDANETVLPSNAVMSSGSVSYTEDAPKIKQVRPYLSFEVAHVINGDEMILTPLVSDWSILEGQIIDITVDRMFDNYGNRQSSPITWSAYVKRNEVAWFVNNGTQYLSAEKQANEPFSFEVNILNKGGKKQSYNIQNIPNWLSTSNSAGTLDPNTTKVITFEVAAELSIGQYALDLFLSTDFDFEEKILLDLRVLAQEPEWIIDPNDFEFNMNIIGKINIDGNFSQDAYTKIAAFVGNALRGVANLEYDDNYDEYFVYLSVFSNVPSGEQVSFKIWDASQGKILQATIDAQNYLAFTDNEVVGYKSMPALFYNTSAIEQHLALNKGWTWISLFAQDPNLGDLNLLTSSMNLSNDDIIKSQLNFDVYDGSTGWNGTLSKSGGLNATSMYKVKFGIANTLIVSGNEVDISQTDFSVSEGWNWLAYPLNNNLSINEALALFNAKEGDVIKNQRTFSIYDPLVGWSGTLNYLKAGEGYMLKSSTSQSLNYPSIFQSTSSGRISESQPTVIENWASYAYNMNIIAEVVVDKSYDYVWAVDPLGTIRGKADIVELDGRKLSYLTVFGNSTQENDLSFYLGNSAEDLQQSIRFQFTPDKLMGTLKSPVALGLDGQNILVYPNAFVNELNLSFHASENQESEVIIYDIQGHEVYRKELTISQGANQVVLNPFVHTGVYVLSLEVDGHRFTTKIIKK